MKAIEEHLNKVEEVTGDLRNLIDEEKKDVVSMIDHDRGED